MTIARFGLYGPTLKTLREENGGELPAFAWPGGYPCVYYDRDGNTLCPDCANKEDEYSVPLAGGDIFYEGPSILCDDCGTDIESAYGDPDAPKDEDEN